MNAASYLIPLTLIRLVFPALVMLLIGSLYQRSQAKNDMPGKA